jgi:hypothetical protein
MRLLVSVAAGSKLVNSGAMTAITTTINKKMLVAKPSGFRAMR